MLIQRGIGSLDTSHYLVDAITDIYNAMLWLDRRPGTANDWFEATNDWACACGVLHSATPLPTHEEALVRPLPFPSQRAITYTPWQLPNTPKWPDATYSGCPPRKLKVCLSVFAQRNPRPSNHLCPQILDGAAFCSAQQQQQQQQNQQQQNQQQQCNHTTLV